MLNLLGEFTLTLDKSSHLIIRHWLAELHIDLFILLKDVHYLLNTFLHNLDDGLVRIHLRFLLQITYRISWSPHHFTLISFFNTGDDLHESRLTRAVETYDTDLGTIKERKVDILEYHSIIVGKNLSYPVH